MIRILFTLLAVLFFAFTPKAQAFECIAADDFGLGGHIYVLANPNEGVASDLLLKSDTTVEKKGYQIAPWIETNLYTTGVSATGADGRTLQRAILKMYVDGRWYPFGRTKPGSILSLSDEEKEEMKNVYSSTMGNTCARDTELPDCKTVACQPREDKRANNSICLPSDGITFDLGGVDRTNVPCCVDGGLGLYGLIAIERNRESSNPNSTKKPQISKTPPTSNFRTFHVHPLKSDANGPYFELDLSKQCFLNDSDQKVCLDDTNEDSNGVVMRGRLYFKINDNFYNDNTGYYSINVISGVYTKMGFIEKTVQTFETQTKLVSAGMFKLISRDVKFIGMVQALLVLYMALFGVMFSMGMVQINQSDLVVRLLKLGIIATLISESSFEFFNTYLFDLFANMGKEISQIIYESTLFYADATTSPKFILPEDSSPLSVYDVMVNMLISRSLNMKILGLLFTTYFWYIPFIYIAIGFVLMGIIRSVVTYVTAIVLVALLLITGPIFLAMMLFKMTQEFFDGWMKLLFAGAMMMIVVAAALAITITLFMNQIENLFGFSVCYQFIWRVITDDPSLCFLGLCPLSWFDIYWWYPNDMFQVSEHLNAKNFFAFLFVGVLFNKIMENIPQLIDTLANNNLQPFSRFSQGASTAFMSSPAMSAVNYARAAPMFLLKDNLIAQKLGSVARKAPIIRHAIKAGQAMADSKLGKGVGGLAKVAKVGATLAADAPNIIHSGTHSQGLISQQGTWAQTLGSAGKDAVTGSVKEFKEAKNSDWYKI